MRESRTFTSHRKRQFTVGPAGGCGFYQPERNCSLRFLEMKKNKYIIYNKTYISCFKQEPKSIFFTFVYLLRNKFELDVNGKQKYFKKITTNIMIENA